ncbi:dienelactone hydrolase family protein [Nitratireductor sp. XY-223]|uniref:dienelactone hydrolase family protein n=1 Tax=Nitratireductor sp. XY-223 TaxID=2561926 RepID=UPI00145AC0D1|nr:dienelactone hydrolase family protein [Nitratireductor sp. XY-223]
MCLIVSILLVLTAVRTTAAENVSFDSLDGTTRITARLLEPATDPPHRTIVFLHGCSGTGFGGGLSPVYSTWAQHLNEAGYAVLIVDSATPRGLASTCGSSAARRIVYAKRPFDAYGALRFLQSLPSIQPDGIGLMGWSQGGGIVLLTIVDPSIGRPVPAPAYDFRAAVALYPSACSDRLQSRPFTAVEPQSWSTGIPLLVLFGARDNWTDPDACRSFIEAARERGEPVEIKLYRNAVHSFDAPNVRLQERSGPRLRDGSLPLIGTDQAAREDALDVVPEFFGRHMSD